MNKHRLWRSLAVAVLLCTSFLVSTGTVAAAASLTLTPTRVNPTGRVVVDGRGFGANDSVLITVANGNREYGRFTEKSDAAGNIGFALVPSQAIPVGTYVVTATGTNPPEVARAQFEVVPEGTPTGGTGGGVATAPFCRPGEPPAFLFGFATLKGLLGDLMGDALECQHPNPQNGDVLQQTSTGLAFWRKSTNTNTFTNGNQHWALTTAGFVTWFGDAIDPPANAQPATGGASPPPTAPAAPAPQPPATPARRMIPAPPDQPLPCLAENPNCGRAPWWLERNALQSDEQIQYEFLGTGLTTDARYIEAIWLLSRWEEGASLLGDANDFTVSITVVPNNDEFDGAYSPRLHRIVVVADLAKGPTWLVALVIAHELRHAQEQKAGVNQENTADSCIANEQQAFATEVRFIRWVEARFGGLPKTSEVAANYTPRELQLYGTELTLLTAFDRNYLVKRAYQDVCS